MLPIMRSEAAVALESTLAKTGASEVPRSVLEGWQETFVNTKEEEKVQEDRRRHEAAIRESRIF